MTPYMKRWLPDHLTAAGRSDDVTTCVTDARFIGAAYAAGHHLDLCRFWSGADTVDFADSCVASYDAMEKESRRPRTEADDSGTVDLFTAARATGQLFQACGVYDCADTWLERALTLATTDERVEDVGDVHLDLAWNARLAEDYPRALRHAEYASSTFHATGNADGEGLAASTLGICLWHLQDDCAAIRTLERARTLCLQTHDQLGEARILNHLGIVHRGVGQYEEALDYLHSAESFYDRTRDARALGKCCNSLGTAYWWSGNYDEALTCYRRADDYNQRTHQRYVLGLTANNLGYLHLERGELDEARRAFRRASSIRQSLGTRGYELMDLSGLALTEFRLGHDAAARRASLSHASSSAAAAHVAVATAAVAHSRRRRARVLYPSPCHSVSTSPSGAAARSSRAG
jgi:tetratricopeptide (TPR) repeat protein